MLDGRDGAVGSRFDIGTALIVVAHLGLEGRQSLSECRPVAGGTQSRSDLTEELGHLSGDLQAPTCYQLDYISDEKIWMWLEDVVRPTEQKL